MPSDPESEGACCVETIKGPIEDSRTLLLDFLKRGRLLNNPSKKIEIKRRATKLIIVLVENQRAMLDQSIRVTCTTLRYGIMTILNNIRLVRRDATGTTRCALA